MTATLTRTEFDIEVSDHGLDWNLPQKVGRALWKPMLAMALVAFPAGAILAAVRANAIATGGSPAFIAAYDHLAEGTNFLAFAAVFSAISFVIARILGEFRTGGGKIQEAVGSNVETLLMPATAKAFIGLMAMSMMIILTPVVINYVVAAQILSGSANALAHAQQWSIWLEGVRKFGMGLYLFAITLGLSTIIYVLRFQGIRIRELAASHTK